MRANVYTGFLTRKIKVYPTESKEKPRCVRGDIIRKAFPLLMASVIPFMGGCFHKNGNLQDEKVKRDKVYALSSMIADNDVTEYLSQEEIKFLMKDPAPTVLLDVNFNHLPTDKDNFWEIVRNGLQIINTDVAQSTNLSATQKSEYRITAFKMLSQISRKKGSMDEVDVRDFNNLKSFLYFEKVVQHRDNYSEVLERSAGVIDERCEFFGKYYQDLLALKEKISSPAGVGVRKFAEALYACDARFMLSYNDSVQANEISRELLADWLEKQHIEDKNLWYYVDVKEDDFCNALAFYNRRGQNLEGVLGVDPKGDLGDGFYSPVGSVIIHELQHLGQQKPASREKPEDNQKDDKDVVVQSVYYDDYTKELGPTLYSLVIEDQIYKKIHGFQADEVMNYGEIDLGTHKVNLGETAVWFSKMMNKYGAHLSIDKMMSEPEVFNHINALGNGTNVISMQKARGGME